MRFNHNYFSQRDESEMLSSHPEEHKQSDQEVSLLQSFNNKQKPIQKRRKPNMNPSKKRKQKDPIQDDWSNRYEEEKKEAPHLSKEKHSENLMVHEEDPLPMSDHDKEIWSKNNQKDDHLDLHPKSKTKKESTNQKDQITHSQKKQGKEKQFNLDTCHDLHIIFLDFFYSIDQSKLLIFDQDIRMILNKMHNPEREFTPVDELKPQGLEKIKASNETNRLNIFNGELYNQGMQYQNFLEDMQTDKQKIIKLFSQASYIFFQEVTYELYKILRQICNIVLEFRKDYQQMKRRLRQFGDRIASQEDTDHQYFYFGFWFTQIPEQRTIQNEEVIKIRKIELKPQFRQAGTQFAEFAERTGLYLLEQMKSLRLWKLI